MVANLMNLWGAKPKVTVGKLLGLPSAPGSWAAKADLYFRAMTKDEES